jgi:hypothetical protein
MNITNYKNIGDWFYLVPAVLVVDVIVIFLSKYPSNNPTFNVSSLNEWYTKFGLSAVASDVLSILLVFMVTRYIYTTMNLKNPLLFLLILVLFQVAHDIFFYTQVILKMPEGHNQMIDVFKSYADENGAKVLVADAIMMVSSAVLASALKSSEGHVTIATLLITLYSMTYIIYTN